MLALLLWGALAASPPAPASADDGPSASEVQLLLQSIQPAHRAGVQVAVGGLPRLPLYRVQVDVDPLARTFSGEEQIRYPTPQPLSALPLRLYDDASYLSMEGERAVRISDVRCPGQRCTLIEGGEPTLYRVAFDPPVAAGQTARVDLAFEGVVPALDPAELAAPSQLKAQVALLRSRGGGPTDHGAFAEGEGVLALTGLFPQVAPRTPEGFDASTPTGVGEVASYDVSNYLFTARVPQGTQVVAGGTKLGASPEPNGHTRYSFAAAAVRDFPVYASSRWTTAAARAGLIKVTAYTLPGDEARGKKILDVAVHALEDFEARFGPYPWTDFALVEQALTGGAGGIEYPTVVGLATLLYRSQQAMGPLAALLTSPQLGSRAAHLDLGDRMLELAVAHEVAHQWWSSLVGPDPHRHPAVGEPLTQYAAALYLESRHGRRAADAALEGQVAMSYQMMRQCGEADAAADRPAGAFASPLQYTGLVCGKAPLFYRAARRLLGEAKLAAALRRYADDYRFREADARGFVLAAAEVAPAKRAALEQLRARWFDQAHGDEDVGALDVGRLVEQATGLRLSSQERAAMQQMMPMLMQLLQNGADPPQLQ